MPYHKICILFHFFMSFFFFLAAYAMLLFIFIFIPIQSAIFNSFFAPFINHQKTFCFTIFLLQFFLVFFFSFLSVSLFFIHHIFLHLLLLVLFSLISYCKWTYKLISISLIAKELFTISNHFSRNFSVFCIVLFSMFVSLFWIVFLFSSSLH